jgi:hypothetical protein
MHVAVGVVVVVDVVLVVVGLGVVVVVVVATDLFELAVMFLPDDTAFFHIYWPHEPLHCAWNSLSLSSRMPTLASPL